MVKAMLYTYVSYRVLFLATHKAHNESIRLNEANI